MLGGKGDAAWFYDQKRSDAAIRTQHTATYGDLRSPMRASFQNVPSMLQVVR